MLLYIFHAQKRNNPQGAQARKEMWILRRGFRTTVVCITLICQGSTVSAVVVEWQLRVVVNKSYLYQLESYRSSTYNILGWQLHGMSTWVFSTIFLLRKKRNPIKSRASKPTQELWTRMYPPPHYSMLNVTTGFPFTFCMANWMSWPTYFLLLLPVSMSYATSCVRWDRGRVLLVGAIMPGYRYGHG